MSSSDQRSRRDRGQRMLDRLAAEHMPLPGVDRAAMFGSSGLRVGGTFYAFVGADGGLVVKVPAARAAALVASGAAVPVQVGRHAAREWIRVPTAGHGEGDPLWAALLREAYRHVGILCRSPTGPATARAEPDQRDG